MTPRMDPERRRALEAAQRELEALHREWLEGMSHYHLRLEAQFRELRRRIKPRPRGAQPAGLPATKHAKEILDDLDRARIKPAKGRSKDLRRVEQALDRAIGRLPPQD